jgi:NADPH-dependent 2,4-dienoyl-CoA reductase/sulfur reductase-like enzyme/rhodanese-related sulfurtransferase
MEVLIIGAGATGLKCAARVRRRNEDAKITVIDKEKKISLGRCGLPYFVSGLVHELDELRKTTYGALRDENYFKKIFNLDVLTETEALEIDRKRRVVKVRKREKEDELNYDYLVIATGAKPVRLFGGDERILTFFDAEDAEKILNLWENGAEKAVVIGAGFIGLELCEALRNIGMEVSLIEAMDQVAPMLDAEMAKLVESHLKENGIDIHLSTRVREIVAKEKLKVIADEEIEADIVVQAVGVKPNVEIAKKAGIELGETGAIRVNEFLQTNDERIYAGGDCVENRHLVTGKMVFAPFGDIANKHGRIIADNITGKKSKFPGIIGTFIFKVFDLTVAKTGISEKEAFLNGFKAKSVRLSVPDKSHYYPKSSNMRIKLVFEENGRVLGAQIVGIAGVDRRIDVFATAIYAGMKLDDLANLDLAYAPPYAPALDPVIVSAYVAINKLEGLFETTRDLAGIVLDVRSEEEAKKNPVQNSINIPILELRERAKELPEDAEITAICSLGLRAYIAQRILRSMGYRVKAYEGGIAFL